MKTYTPDNLNEYNDMRSARKPRMPIERKHCRESYDEYAHTAYWENAPEQNATEYPYGSVENEMELIAAEQRES